MCKRVVGKVCIDIRVSGHDNPLITGPHYHNYLNIWIKRKWRLGKKRSYILVSCDQVMSSEVFFFVHLPISLRGENVPCVFLDYLLPPDVPAVWLCLGIVFVCVCSLVSWLRETLSLPHKQLEHPHFLNHLSVIPPVSALFSQAECEGLWACIVWWFL